MKYLEAEHFSVKLDTHDIVCDVHLSLHRGEMVGLIGPNGAGKSTLMKSMIGLLPRSRGNLKIFGKDEKEYTRRELAKNIAYMPQGEWVHWPLSVKRVISLGRTPHLMPWQQVGPSDVAMVNKLMEKTGISHLSERSMDHLAGGERRLALLARVLAVEAKIIFADEPIAALDPAHELQVMELLKTIASEGHSLLVILHNLTLAARFCDRLLLIHHGRIISQGTPEEVLTPKNLEISYGIEARYGHNESKFFIVPWNYKPNDASKPKT